MPLPARFSRRKRPKEEGTGPQELEPPESPPPLTVQGEVIDSYRVPADADPDASAEFTIVDRDSFGTCIVRLPYVTKKEEQALALLKENLRNAIPVETAGSPEQVLGKYLWETAEKAGLLSILEKAHRKFLYYLLRDFSGFWEIDPLVSDDNIEEISVTRFDRPARIFHRKYSEYMFMETNVVYESEERLQAFIRRLAQFGGTTVSLAQPSLEVVLHGASDRRVSATLGDEISRPGSTYTIRKQKEKALTIVQMAAPEAARPYPVRAPRPEEPSARYEEVHLHKTLTALMAAYFWLLLERTSNLLICGETSSGKTTLMNAILALANPRVKIVTAEDVLEINLPGDLHWQRLKTRSHRAGLSPIHWKIRVLALGAAQAGAEVLADRALPRRDEGGGVGDRGDGDHPRLLDDNDGPRRGRAEVRPAGHEPTDALHGGARARPHGNRHDEEGRPPGRQDPEAGDQRRRDTPGGGRLA